MTVNMIKLPAPMKLYFKEETGSTNDDAMELARSGEADLSVVWALSQTKGRGRRGRKWESVTGNLHWTCVVELERTDIRTETLAFASSLAAADTVDYFLPSSNKSKVKWPNDIIVDDKKISGALLEGGDDLGWVVVGVGINVELTPELTGSIYLPTSLREEGATSTVAEVCQKFSELFLERLGAWRDKGFTELDRSEYIDRMWRYGENVDVSFDAAKKDRINGINRGIDSSCCLILELPTGDITKIYAGDVVKPV